MNLYDVIKKPIENNEILKQLIEFYKKSENPKADLYTKLVTSKENRDFDEEKYKKDYEELIVRPTMEDLYKNIGIRINLNENVFGNNSSILKNVFNECSTYEEFREKLEKTFNETQKNILKKCSWVFTKSKEKFDKYNLTYDQQGWYDDARKIFSDEEIYSLAPYVNLEERMYKQLQVSEDIMGFHVNSEKKMDLNRKNEKNEFKFYINAGDDTCRVASLFRDKCEAREMNYYFKVVNPYKDSLDRTDKLCVYSEIKHVQNFFRILQEIKQENPEFKFEQPPMMAGNIENWIGIASDYSGNDYSNTSYNVAMSHICLKALDEIFKENKEMDTKGDDLQETELIEQLKGKIAFQAQKMGYSKDKVCIKPSAKSILKKININDTKTKNRNAVLQMQNVKSSVKNSEIRISEIKKIIENIKEKISNRLIKHKNKARLEETKKGLNIPEEQIELKWKEDR